MKETKTPPAEAPTVPAAPAFHDLSAEIVRTIAREPDEQVTCRHIYGDHYRCNWWQNRQTTATNNRTIPGLLATMSRIGKSQFLKVTSTATGLSIELRSLGE
jgi:hypothetical protein